MKKDELIVYIFAIAFFVFMLIHSMELRFVRRSAEMGSGFWPILILSAATLLSIVLLSSNLRKSIREKKAGVVKAEISTEDKKELKDRRKKFTLSVICLLIYILIMPLIGFILSTFFYVFAFILALGERRKWVLAFSPVLVTALIVVVFAKFIAMPLPKGATIFAAFSRLFY